jgi:hypothetical protein
MMDVNQPVTNNELKEAFRAFNLNKSEYTLQPVINELKKANFLVLIDTRQLNTSAIEGSDKVSFDKGGVITFLKTYDGNGKSFLPIFTDWNEIDLWLKSRDNIAGWVMPTDEVFTFVQKNTNDAGLVINPCSDKWSMNKEQITAFLKEV